jgi:glycosyltransferase involved in cell wall biosynthesis
MACGAFPIVTDIPANREWVNSGENGILFNSRDWNSLADAIVRALHDPGLRNRAAKMNWEIVQQRASWQNNMTMMEQQYIRLCNS